MLDLYKTELELQEREKREKMDSKWISCLSLLYFFLFLSSLSLSCQYSSFLTQEKRRRSFSCVCVLSENKKPFFFTYDFTRSLAILLKFSNIFVKAKLHAMANFTFSFFETLIQELVTHCHYYLVRECHVLQSLFQNCTCPHRQGGATGCQQSMAASLRSNSLLTMRRPSPGQR